MAHPVYKLYFYKRSPAGLALPAVRMAAAGRQVGLRCMLDANMRWSNESKQTFGVELYPSLEAAQEYARFLEAEGWFEYTECESYLGIPMDGTANDLTPPEPPAPGEASVYRVYLSRLTDYGHSLAPNELDRVWARGREALFQSGGRMILSGYVRWNNEEWESFGVERFPSPEAVVSYSQYLSVSGWYRYSTARSHLGTAIGGEVTQVEA